jgi:flagella basal body P-ring formation protein FlgA
MLTATSICPCHAQEAGRVAVVPNMVIYPGETIRPEAIREVVLNENLYRNATAASAQEVLGKIAVVTLIPNEPIQPRMLRRPAAVQIGAIVSIRYELPGLSISASGTALQAGAIGERIRVKNLDSSAVLVGTVVDGGAVQVTD